MHETKKNDRYFKVISGIIYMYDCDPRETLPGRGLAIQVKPYMILSKKLDKRVNTGIIEIPFPKYYKYYIDNQGRLLREDHPDCKRELFEEFLME